MDLVFDGLAPSTEIHQMAPRFIHPLSGNIQAVDGQVPFLSVYFGVAPLHASNGLWHGVGMEFHLGLHGFAALRGLSLIQLVHMINAEFIPAETQIRFSPVLPEIPAAAESGPADAVEDTAVLPHPENSAKSMVSARRTDIIVRFITDSPF